MKVYVGWFYNLFSIRSADNGKSAVIWKGVKIAAITVAALAFIGAIIGVLGGSIIAAPIYAIVCGIIAFSFIVPCTALAIFRLSSISLDERNELDLSYVAVKGGISDIYKNHKGVFVGIIVATVLVSILSGIGFIPFGIIGFVAALVCVVPCTYFAGGGIEDLCQKGKSYLAEISFIESVRTTVSSAMVRGYSLISGTSSISLVDCTVTDCHPREGGDPVPR